VRISTAFFYVNLGGLLYNYNSEDEEGIVLRVCAYETLCEAVQNLSDLSDAVHCE